jgi:hypothetical protein
VAPPSRKVHAARRASVLQDDSRAVALPDLRAVVPAISQGYLSVAHQSFLTPLTAQRRVRVSVPSPASSRLYVQTVRVTSHYDTPGQTAGRPAADARGQASQRLPSADTGGELPPVDGGQRHTAEAMRSRLPRQQSSRSRPGRPPSSSRGARSPRGILPAPDAV